MILAWWPLLIGDLIDKLPKVWWVSPRDVKLERNELIATHAWTLGHSSPDSRVKMGSSTKKKKEKQKDFQKPKLKVGKTKAKAANFTDTSFKSKGNNYPSHLL